MKASDDARRTNSLWQDFLAALAIPLAVISIIRMSTEVFEVKLYGVLKEFISFYGHYADVVIGWLPRVVLTFDPPALLLALWTVSAWLTIIQVFATKRAAPDVRLRIPIMETVGGSAMAIFLTYSLIGMAVGLWTLSFALSVSNRTVERISDERVNMVPYVRWLKRSLWSSLVGAAAFFAMNAYVAQSQ